MRLMELRRLGLAGRPLLTSLEGVDFSRLHFAPLVKPPFLDLPLYAYHCIWFRFSSGVSCGGQQEEVLSG